MATELSAPMLSDDESRARLRTFRRPPEGFDPLTASKRQLTIYGLPHRPDEKTHPRQAELWRTHMADLGEFIAPELRFDPSVRRSGGYHGPLGLAGLTPPDHPFLTVDKRFVDRPDLIPDDFLVVRNLSAELSNNWSGAYVNQPPREPFNNIFAIFNVPGVQPPPSAWNGKRWDDGVYQAATWVGLDGWKGPDVMQAGVVSLVTVKNGVASYTYQAWVEFWPTAWAPVTNFTVSPADILAVTVCAPFGTTHGVAMFTNKTTGVSIQPVGFDAPSGTALTGVVAEWIVEYAQLSQSSTFANYGNVTFNDCIAGSRTQERDLRSANRLNLTDGSGAVLSTGWLETRSQLRCTYGP